MSIPNVQPLPSKSPPSCQAAKPGGRGQTNYRVCEGSEQALSGTEGKDMVEGPIQEREAFWGPLGGRYL